jgi:class 3 adenylate cyclase
MTENWKSFKLGEIADIQNGFAFKSKDLGAEGIPVIKIKNIVPPNVVLEGAGYFIGEITSRLEKYILKKNDFLISMTGSTVNVMSSAVGKMGRYRSDKIALLNQRAGKIYITDQELDGQEFTVSKNPNLIISNNSSKKTVCFIDKLNWKEEAIYASEVSSSHDFRELFSQETLKETSKVKASEVTMLFTDLMNSTELYLQEGDESAIGRVMGHFKIIQHIVAEERGGIVKTIGDSVMAVFWEPVSALKAVQRIQQIFTTSTSMGDAFKIKAGIHFGDCTAVNLNGRIDYFGTTVNIASRLVDVASEKEIMVSEAVFNHPDVQLYLEKNSETFFVKESMKELKGFDDEEFKVKQIRLERPPMRLVI